MLNAADPTKKIASLCFIFPSFQQKILDRDLKHLGKNGTTDKLSEPVVMGSVNRHLLSTFRRGHMNI